MSVRPPSSVEASFLNPTSTLTRRCEIYESDGVTQWLDGANDGLLLGGSVSLDYSRDERRSVDLELDNSEWQLQHSPTGFWYDKVLKIFSGISFVDTALVATSVNRFNYVWNPRAGIDSSYHDNILSAAGMTLARITGSGSPVSDTAVALTFNTSKNKSANGLMYKQTVATPVLTPGQAYSFSTYAKCSKDQVLRIQLYWMDTTGTILGLGGEQISVPVTANTWNIIKLENMVAPAGATRYYTILSGSTVTSAVNWQALDVLMWTGLILNLGPKAYPYFSGASATVANRTYSWSGATDASTSIEATAITVSKNLPVNWEVQIGEFMIDSISESHFPYTTKITGRDYAKKCILSKFAIATSAASGTAIETVIKSIAVAAGITKFTLPTTGKTLGKEYFFDRGMTRWDAMSSVANAFGFELYFDNQGYLVMRAYLDPVVAPFSYELLTGPFANLTEFTKSSTDTQVYNHVVVTGASTDNAVLPVYAQALNNAPTSPTRIAKLGDRVYEYASEFIVTTVQAQDVANKFLKIHALEAYDFSFGAIALPWLEVGEIVKFTDPRQVDTDPTRFLLTSISLPLDLGPMSGSAKRVSVVG